MRPIFPVIAAMVIVVTVFSATQGADGVTGMASVPVEGVVLLEGVPVAKAEVHADWLGVIPGTRRLTSKSLTVTTDDSGQFHFEGPPARFAVVLRVERGDAFSAGAIRVTGIERQKLEIAISSKNGARLSGRVIDSKGTPLRRARVVVRFREGWQNNSAFPGEIAVFLREGKLQTDSDGRFKTPAVPRDRSYRFLVDMAGHEAAISDWFRADDATHDLIVNRLINVVGTVRDRAGQPAAGAKVAYTTTNHRAEAIANGEGRFELRSVPETSGFLTIGHGDFRFHGEWLSSLISPIERILVRTSEPSTTVMKTRPLVPREERLKLARRVLDPLADRLLNPQRAGENESAERQVPFRRGREQQLLQLAQAMAKAEPQFVLDYLDKHPALSEGADTIRVQVANELRYRNVERTRDLIAQTQNAGSACMMLCSLFDVIDPKDRESRLGLLSEALIKARATKDPSFRVLGLAKVGARLFDLGEKERANVVLREGEEAAKQLPPLGFAGYARGVFAEQLATIDVEAALALTQGLGVSLEFVRHHGNMAYRLAGIDPAQAERVLNLITPKKETSGFDRDHYAIRVCNRMAPRDLPRARRIADSTRLLVNRAYAYGVMADALARSQPDTATELLRRAFAILDEVAAQPESSTVQTLSVPAPTAGALLATAEHIDPALLAEFFWHAVSFQRPHTEDQEQIFRVSLSNGALAGFVARYDVTIAAKLLNTLDEPPAPRSLASVAQLLIDPVKAVEMVEAMPEGAALDRKDRMRLELAEQLASRDTRYWQLPTINAGIWIVGAEEGGE
jgi:hypothetical protein